MRLLVTAATEYEIRPLQERGMEAEWLITGVGSAATLYHLTKRICQTRYDMVLQTGLAGSFSGGPALGESVFVHSDCFAASGIREGGRFTPLQQTHLAGENHFPFIDGKLLNSIDLSVNHGIRSVASVTVDTVTDDAFINEEIRHVFQPEIETMEGAAFHYVCLMEKQPFIQIRGISNEVGERDKNKWKMDEALNNAADFILKWYRQFS